MKLQNKSSLLIPIILVICYFMYFILSWILLFRDKRALEGIALFYPELSTFLFTTRDFLLQNNLNTIPTFLFGLISLIAILCYLLSLRAKISLKTTILFASVFACITFLSYPILSTDIFSYMFSERVATVHNENVWKVAPANFPNDSFYKISDWKETTSVYGGIHFISYYLPSIIGQNNLLLLTILYKMIPALSAVGIAYVSYLLLKMLRPDFVEKGLRLIIWSPLFILEIFGSGHNDSLMIFFTVLSFYLYKKKQWLASGMAIAFAVQVKILPIVLVFFFIYALVQQRLIKNALIFFSVFIFTNILIFSLMGVTIADFITRVLYNNGVYWQSLNNVLRNYISGGNSIIFGGFILWLIYLIGTKWKRVQAPEYLYTLVMLVYLLFVSSAYWNWYVLWLLPFLPFIKNRNIAWTVLAFSFTSLLAYPLLWLSLRFGFGSSIWPIITYIFIFLVPFGVYLWLRFNEKSADKLLNRFALQKVFADSPQH